MLDLRRMMLLCDLAELGTVTAVAERRSITSSAVSQQLRVLEDEAGATLFRREGRTLGLTRGGLVLAEHARRVLGAVDEALSAVASTADRTSGRLIVASFNLGIRLLAAPMTVRLAQVDPEIGVQIRQLGRADALRQLRQGEADLAITCEYDFGRHESFSGLRGIPLLTEPMVLLAAQNRHAAIRCGGLGVLADDSWATGIPGSGLHTALLRAADRVGFTPHITHQTMGAANACELAAAGIAVALVPALAVSEQLAPLVVEGLDMESRRIEVVTRAGRLEDPNALASVRVLQEVAAEVEASITGSWVSVA